MSVDSSLWLIPNHWQWKTLRDLGDIVSGGTPSTKQAEYWGGDIKWISPSDLTGYKNKIITQGAKSLTEKGLRNSSAKIMPAGSVHFSSRAPIGYVAISGNEISTNQGFKSLVPSKEVFNEYVYYYLKGSKQLAEQNASGTTFLELSGKAFGKLPIPIPPLHEQKSIVTKIEELFSELDSGIASLKTTQQQLGIYRQALLKHAFEGKLTEQWRKDNADKLETPEQLLARIQQERDARYQQQLEAWQQAVKDWEIQDKEGSRPKKPTKLGRLAAINDSSVVALPKNWCWVHFGGVITIASNLVSPLDFPDCPHIAPDNIERNTGKLLSYKTIAEDGVTSPKHYFYAGQVIYSKIRPNLAKLVHVEFDGLCSADMYPIQSDYYEHVFLKYLMLTKDFVTQASTAGSRSVLPKINQAELNRLTIPLCCLEEQRIVVEMLEEKLSLIEQNEKEIEAALAKAELLRQSILKKAFSGQLL